MSELPFKRRNLLKTATTGTLIGSLGVTTAKASEEPSLSHSRQTRRINQGNVSSVIHLTSENVDLDSSEDRVLRIEDSQNQSVRLVPHSDELIELPGNISLLIYDVMGQIKDEPLIRVSGPIEDISVDVTGDTSMFETDPIFTEYTVQLVEGDKTIASTDEHAYGIGHPDDAFFQDSTTGEIEVTYELSNLIDESWTLILALRDYDFEDGTTIQTLKSEFDYEDGTFVTTFDADQVDPLPEDAFRDIDVDFYDQAVDPDAPEEIVNLWYVTDIEVDESDQTDPEPDTELTVQPLSIADVGPDDSFSVAVTVEETAGHPAENTEVSFTISPSGADTTIYTETVSVGELDADAETTVTFGEDEDTPEVGPLAEGDYEATVEVAAANAGTVRATESFTVSDEPDEDPTAEDFITRDEAGNVEDVEVFDAIDAFRGDQLESGELFDVISAFREA